MSSASNEQKEQHGSREPRNTQGDNNDGRHSGEGAASALAQMISQGKQHRHNTGEADEGSGGHSQ